MGKFVDRSGLRYGRLTAIEPTERRNSCGSIYWKCACDCGKTVEVSASCLQTNQTRSCGCLFLEVAAGKGRAKKIHGMTGTRAYKSWSGMKERCFNEKNAKYKNYGGRGIKVCERWMSFENFYADMGDPKDGESIDRIDTNGDYEPSNCRWASQVVQQNNRRDNVEIWLDGCRKTMSQYAKDHGLNADKIQRRLKCGWSIEKACAP